MWSKLLALLVFEQASNLLHIVVSAYLAFTNPTRQQGRPLL